MQSIGRGEVSARALAPPAGEVQTKLMDAAERLLVGDGYAGITTRRVAAEAGVNHGLVHYYFGSMDELFLQVLERFTDRLIERQRQMYETDLPFLERWRLAMRYLDEDFASGYQKVWLELQAMAWNRSDLRERIARVDAEWRATLTEAFAPVIERYGLTDHLPVAAAVSLVMTFNQGLILERLSGVTEGHQELLSTIDRWLSWLEDQEEERRG